MDNFINIGKIVRAVSQDMAKSLFSHRKQNGIAGVIFVPEITIQPWQNGEKETLAAETYHSISATDPQSCPNFCPTEKWTKVANIAPQQLASVSMQFNVSSKSRIVQFFYDDGFKEKPHRDRFAADGWLHYHIAGSGLLCVNPISRLPIHISTTDETFESVDQENINALIALRQIEIIALKEREAIIFDETMVHFSSDGARFRAVTFG